MKHQNSSLSGCVPIESHISLHLWVVSIQNASEAYTCEGKMKGRTTLSFHVWRASFGPTM